MKFKSYAQYKDSGVKLIRKIPAHWDIQKLKYIASVRFSSVNKKTENGELPTLLCNYQDVYYNDYISPNIAFMEATASPDEIANFTLRKGDVIVTKDSESWDDIAVSAYVPFDLNGVLCGYHLAQIHPDPALVDGEYLFRSFGAHGINDQFRVAATGITRYGLGKYWIDNAFFPVPPIDEQHRIKTFLNREIAKIDALIEKKERLIELLQEKRTALITHAVSKGLPAAAAVQACLDTNVPMKDSGVEWLGRIPAHWEVWNFKSVARLEYGDALPTDEYEAGDIEVYGSNGPVGNHSNANTLSPVLIIGRKGSFGKVNYSKTPVFAIDTTYFIDKRVSRANLRWLYYLMQVLGLDSYSEDSAIPGLSRRYVYSHFVPFPSIPEQLKIASFLDRETGKIDNLIAIIHEGIDHLKEYRTALISAAVTGKIDVREEAA
jgi:type I restriction enzyme, S subunit